jgi:hypothetical protein
VKAFRVSARPVAVPAPASFATPVQLCPACRRELVRVVCLSDHGINYASSLLYLVTHERLRDDVVQTAKEASQE